MRIIIPVFIFLLLIGGAAWGQNQPRTVPPATPEAAPEDADTQQMATLLRQGREAYGQRNNLDSLLRAIELFQQARQFADNDVDLDLEYCRAILWLEGYYFRGNVNEQLIQEGMVITGNIVRQQPDNVAAHYMHGLLNGFHGKYIDSLASLSFFAIMEDELFWVEKNDNYFDYGGIYRAWGNYYAQLPGFLGGDTEKARIYLLHGLELYPEYYLNNILLAQLYRKQEQWEQAYEMLQIVIDSTAPAYEELAPEWHMWKARAARIKARLDEQAPLEIAAAFAAPQGNVNDNEANQPEASAPENSTANQPANIPSE